MADDLDIYEGEDKTWTVTITDSTGTAVDITGYTFLFTVKRKLNDSDGNALMQKEFTSHSDPTNGITEIIINSADTGGLNGNFFYDYQWKDTSALRRPVLKTAAFKIEQRTGDTFT